MYIHDARQKATSIYSLSSVLQGIGMVENNAVVSQTIHRGEVKSPRMVQTDNALSATLVQPLQEVQPMAA